MSKASLNRNVHRKHLIEVQHSTGHTGTYGKSSSQIFALGRHKMLHQTPGKPSGIIPYTKPATTECNFPLSCIVPSNYIIYKKLIRKGIKVIPVWCSYTKCYHKRNRRVLFLYTVWPGQHDSFGGIVTNTTMIWNWLHLQINIYNFGRKVSIWSSLSK